MPNSEEYPPILKPLFTKEHHLSKTFYEHIRQLNSSFSFASVNAHVKSLKGQYHYRIQESLYHLFNHASHPILGEPPSYAHVFFLDTQEASMLRSQNPCNTGINYDLFYEIENEFKLIENSLREAYKIMWEIEKEQEKLAQ